MAQTDEQLCLNGIDADTGEYLVPPVDVARAAAMIRGETTPAAAAPDLVAIKPDASDAGWLRRVWRVLSQPHLGLPMDIDPASVAQAGWAIVFHEAERAEVEAALEPLIAHRRTRVPADRCHVLTYKTGQTRATWLASYGAAAGSVLPQRVPYYLLLVGGPERIPFTLCHQLDVEYAIGCLHFDTPAEYEHYARSVIDYETSAAVPNARTVTMFATRHDDDVATQLSADRLVTPLASQPTSTFGVDLIVGDRARKEALVDAICPRGETRPPAIVLTASHGMAWRRSHPRQAAEQGALICQEWEPGVPPVPAQYVAAADLPPEGRVHGAIAFHFACYGAGTPQHDRFLHRAGQPPPAIAERPFVAALPKALLTHPRGGALAVIGHVERAWGCSIVARDAGAQLLPFRNALDRLAIGQPVGHAMKDFNERYAALSTSLASLLEDIGFGARIDDGDLVRAWAERNDAEGYLIIGDPAVALRVDRLTA